MSIIPNTVKLYCKCGHSLGKHENPLSTTPGKCVSKEIDYYVNEPDPKPVHIQCDCELYTGNPKNRKTTIIFSSLSALLFLGFICIYLMSNQAFSLVDYEIKLWKLMSLGYIMGFCYMTLYVIYIKSG